MRPVVQVAAWSELRTAGHHGPGLAYTLMSMPRAWEHGAGTVLELTPPVPIERALAQGQIDLGFYLQEAARFIGLSVGLGELRPGHLTAEALLGSRRVRSGDTLCCSCPPGAPCHRRVAALALLHVGWDVVLYGDLLTSDPQLFQAVLEAKRGRATADPGSST